MKKKIEKPRFIIDKLDEKIVENKKEIGYPLHYQLHCLCKELWKKLEALKDEKQKILSDIEEKSSVSKDFFPGDEKFRLIKESDYQKIKEEDLER